MLLEEVNLRATTAAVLEGFNHGFVDMVIVLLQQHNIVATTSNAKRVATYADARKG